MLVHEKIEPHLPEAAALPDSLERPLAQALEAVRAAPDDLVSITLPLADGLMPAPIPGPSEFFFLGRPAEGHALLGFGSAARVEAEGPHRFALLAHGLEMLRKRWFRLDPQGMGLPPLALVGFAFDGGTPLLVPSGLPIAMLNVPTLLVRRRDGRCDATFSARWEGAPRAAHRAWMAAAEAILPALARPPSPVAPRLLQRVASRPNDRLWLARTAEAVADIRQGRLGKVVISRRIRIAAEGGFDAARVAARLTRHRAEGTVFAIQHSGTATVGASPERLVALDHGRITADVIAGTQGGTIPDQFPGAPLLASGKDRHEHRLVVEAITDSLAPLSREVRAPERPRLLRLPGLHHLWTPVSADAKPGVTLFDLAERVHPTPAVGGTPRAAALEWLKRNGERRLGWYTGAVGWVTPEGDGDLALALRCAMLNAHGAELSAGAGIVAGSDPAREMAETELKLSTMLDALEEA